MAEYILIRNLTLELPRKEVFDFFADALNLERITPPELRFNVVTPQPITIRQGTLLDYNLRLYGFPMKWQSEISVWNPPHSFTDKAIKGPYKQWIHKHKFTELDENKTLIEDEVRYRLPLEPVGDLAHWFVRRQLNHIFDFRQRAVADILADKSEG